MVNDVCPTLLHMTSTWNKTPDFLLFSPMPYTLGNVIAEAMPYTQGLSPFIPSLCTLVYGHSTLQLCIRNQAFMNDSIICFAVLSCFPCTNLPQVIYCRNKHSKLSGETHLCVVIKFTFWGITVCLVFVIVVWGWGVVLGELMFWGFCFFLFCVCFLVFGGWGGGGVVALYLHSTHKLILPTPITLCSAQPMTGYIMQQS